MPDREEWLKLIRSKYSARPTPVVMATFLEKIGSVSQPVKLIGQDGSIYLAKGRQNGRMIVNEQIVGMLGELINAPVGSPLFANVPPELIALEPQMSHMPEGVCHATSWIENCTDRQGITYTNVPGNKERFACLAVLYSWVQANDHQWIYKTTSPQLVYSVDHGHFFPGGPTWTTASLGGAGNPSVDNQFDVCGLSPGDYDQVMQRLRDISASEIATAVARPPDDWTISEDERVEVAIYLEQRRATLVSVLGGTP